MRSYALSTAGPQACRCSRSTTRSAVRSDRCPARRSARISRSGRLNSSPAWIVVSTCWLASSRESCRCVAWSRRRTSHLVRHGCSMATAWSGSRANPPTPSTPSSPILPTDWSSTPRPSKPGLGAQPRPGARSGGNVVVASKPLEGRVQDNLRRWRTGGFCRISGERPFGDVIDPPPTRPAERKLANHPSPKPRAFLRRVVRGDLLLGKGVVPDPFAGSGSTLAAAVAVG